jgi:hypothetical protein
MQAVLEKGGLFRFCAKGASMTPFVRDGDTITIAPLGNLPPRLGEVVAFRDQMNGLRPVVHRVVGRHAEGFIVQGDGNGCMPEVAPPELVLGRLVKLERNGRPIRLGLGPERRILAWMSRSRFLWKRIWPAWNRIRPFFRKSDPRC